MLRRFRMLGLLAAAFFLVSGQDLLACGDKFLVAGRGTRYQRPKNVRAAAVVIYADPASGLPRTIGKMPMESVLQRVGHRSTTVQTFEQLSAVLAGGRFEVVVASSDAIAAVEKLLDGLADAPVMVALKVGASGAEPTRASLAVKAAPRERALLEAIDTAVERYDRSHQRTARE